MGLQAHHRVVDFESFSYLVILRNGSPLIRQYLGLPQLLRECELLLLVDGVHVQNVFANDFRRAFLKYALLEGFGGLIIPTQLNGLFKSIRIRYIGPGGQCAAILHFERAVDRVLDRIDIVDVHLGGRSRQQVDWRGGHRHYVYPSIIVNIVSTPCYHLFFLLILLVHFFRPLCFQICLDYL